VNPSQSQNDVLLDVKNLKMYFPVTRGLLKRTIAEVKAVDNVSFKIKRGETLHFLLNNKAIIHETS